MTKVKFLYAVLAVTVALAAVPAANAAIKFHFNGAGSSAMYQGFGVAVTNDIAPNATTCGGAANVGTNCTIHHFTVKGSCTSFGGGANCAQLFDGRGATETEQAQYWIVYVCSGPTATGCTGTNTTDAWIYNQVDSTVGVRMFLAQPSALSQINLGTQVGLNIIIPKLLLYGVNNGDAGCGGASTCDDASLPADLAGAAPGGANGQSVTTGMTDIRPEDAYYATQRSLTTSVSTAAQGWVGLGYGPGPIGTPIKSGQPSSTATATPVAFSLPGNPDPINTSLTVPTTINTFSVGESPMVFVVNRTNPNGFGKATGVVPFYSNLKDNAGALGTQNALGLLWGGNDCAGDNAVFGLGGSTPGGVNFPIPVQLREPLSGTMNTTEFSAFDTFGGNLATVSGSEVGNSPLITPSTSQEANVNGPVNNPLNNLPCTAGSGGVKGSRYRAIGTGEEVGHTSPAQGVAGHQDGIGYTFFSFGNVSPLTAVGGYLTLDGVDPVFNTYSGGDPGQPATTPGTVQGSIPTCNAALGNAAGGCTRNAVFSVNLTLCPDGNGCSFPHLRDGTYRAWSLLRALCDTAVADCTDTNLGTEGIIEHTQQDVHNSASFSTSDFLPFDLAGAWNKPFGDASYVRSHYAFENTVGAGNNLYPDNHANSVVTFHISATFPAAGVVSDLPSDPNPEATVPEVGGDAGGCIIPAQVKDSAGNTYTNTGSVLQIGSILYPAPVVGKTKYFYTLAAGSEQPKGLCGGGANNGQQCVESYTGTGATTGTPGIQCGTTITCNPGPKGMSLSAVGAANNLDNGTFQVTRIVNTGQIKVKVPTGRGGDITPVTLGPGSTHGTITFSTGCSQ